MTEDELYNEICSELEFGETIMIGGDRMRVLFDLVRETMPSFYPMAEVGVWRGGSSRLLARADHNRGLYAFDTFEGAPFVDPKRDVMELKNDNYPLWADTSLERVEEFLGQPGPR